MSTAAQVYLNMKRRALLRDLRDINSRIMNTRVTGEEMSLKMLKIHTEGKLEEIEEAAQALNILLDESSEEDKIPAKTG